MGEPLLITTGIHHALPHIDLLYYAHNIRTDNVYLQVFAIHVHMRTMCAVQKYIKSNKGQVQYTVIMTSPVSALYCGTICDICGYVHTHTDVTAFRDVRYI